MASRACPLKSGDGLLKTELTTDVEHAVTRLKELGSHMKDHSHQFTNEDLDNIDELIHYLKELDEKRITTHELLEAETISNSVFRRKLESFPLKTLSDVQEKVQSARDLNAEQISSLQTHAAKIAEEKEHSIRLQEVLNMHNGLLESEQKKLSEMHSVLVKRLNGRMAERASVQIELNETSKEFKDTVEKVNSVKQEIREVEEGMEKVMKRFTGDMHSLNNMLEEVKTQKKQALEENTNLEMKLEALKDKVIDGEFIVEEKLTVKTQYEADIKGLSSTEISTKTQIVEGKEEIEELKEQCTVIEKEDKALQEDYQEKEVVVADKRSHLKRQTEFISAELKKLTILCRGLKRELKVVADDSSMQQDVLKDIKKKVSDTKNNLLSHAEEGAQLKSDYGVLVKNLNELKVTHQETISVMEDELIQLQLQLRDSGKTKDTVQSGYDELTKEVEAKTLQHKEEMADLQLRLADGKKSSEDLSQRRAFLETATEQCCGEVVVYEGRLGGAHSTLVKRRKSLTAVVDDLEENASDLRVEIGDRDETLSRIKPQWIVLDKEHEEKSEVYDEEKRELITLKSRKSELQDRMREVQQTLEKMHLPRQALKLDTLRCRAYTRQKVFQHTTEVGKLEKQVTEANQKFIAIHKENRRIIESSRTLSDEIERMRHMLTCSKDVEGHLDIALKMYKDKLSQQWKRHQEMEKAVSARDKLILKDITELRAASANRHKMISNLHGRYKHELREFSDYLLVTAKGSAS